ncbi:hypothetical protein KDA_54090 [Dictyobacter alpinus]|uniref:Uncharacterized protein n=1 Tax=Dictyobacter alpinus TaxID=2014873 RepID=A0A402BEY5_9CHLR|nr:hypothetical protein KDA_54090 [Dictyobacter alpinus]
MKPTNPYSSTRDTRNKGKYLFAHKDVKGAGYSFQQGKAQQCTKRITLAQSKRMFPSAHDNPLLKHVH